MGDLGRAGAVKRLQAAVARLRRALDPDGAGGQVLRTVADGYLPTINPGEPDAHTRHDYADMPVARGQPGDNDKALELIEQVLAT